MKTKFIHKKNS